MAHQGPSHTMMNSRKSYSRVLKRSENTAYVASAAQTTVSMPTQWMRASRGNRLCSVTPEEYRSSVLMANSCTIAKTRYGTTNQAGNADGRPETDTAPAEPAAASAGTQVATAAPRISSSADGTAPPRATAATMRFRLAAGGR